VRTRPVPLFQTLLRLRCPHCGAGAVVERHFRIRERCSECNLRYRRGGPEYFSGAMFINYFLSAGSVAATFLFLLLITWPTVPWTALAYGLPLLAVVLIILLYPVSRVIFLTVDVRMHPVAQDELA
jgi:uncharacterized protein (DUF983 family)